MTDSEDDYMSDKFLARDHKPGLMPKIFLQKHQKIEEGKIKAVQNKTKPLKLEEVEKRTEKLNEALDETNKGFSLLSKMGFKKGMGLGKKGNGLVIICNGYFFNKVNFTLSKKSDLRTREI